MGVRKDLEEKPEIAKLDWCSSCNFWGVCVAVTFPLWQYTIHLSLQNAIQRCSQMFQVIFLRYLDTIFSPATWTGIGKDTIRLQSQDKGFYSKTSSWLSQNYRSNCRRLVEQDIYKLLVTAGCWLCLFIRNDWWKSTFFSLVFLLALSVEDCRRATVQVVHAPFSSLLIQGTERKAAHAAVVP